MLRIINSGFRRLIYDILMQQPSGFQLSGSWRKNDFATQNAFFTLIYLHNFQFCEK